VTVYAEKRAIYTLFKNTQIMLRSHVGIKPTCLIIVAVSYAVEQC